jgi:hypothetical protein
MTKRKKLFLKIILVYLAIFALSLFFNTKENYRGPFIGRVVDQETNQPIEGAVIYVLWEAFFTRAGNYFDAQEVLTDKQGNFHIGTNWSFNPLRTLNISSTLLIYKAGYGQAYLNYPNELESIIENRKARTLEQKIQRGSDGYFDIRMEGDFPIFLLTKLKTDKEIKDNATPQYGTDVPMRKRKHLMEEINKARKSLGWPEYQIK